MRRKKDQPCATCLLCRVSVTRPVHTFHARAHVNTHAGRFCWPRYGYDFLYYQLDVHRKLNMGPNEGTGGKGLNTAEKMASSCTLHEGRCSASRHCVLTCASPLQIPAPLFMSTAEPHHGHRLNYLCVLATYASVVTTREGWLHTMFTGGGSRTPLSAVRVCFKTSVVDAHNWHGRLLMVSKPMLLFELLSWDRGAGACRPDEQERGASWCKLLAVSDALDRGYEIVVFIDSDAYFALDDNHRRSVPDVLARYGAGTAWDAYPVWCPPNTPWGDDAANSGLQFWINSEASKGFLKKWWEYSANPKAHPYEQTVLEPDNSGASRGLIESVGILRGLFWQSKNQWENFALAHISSMFKKYSLLLLLLQIRTPCPLLARPLRLLPALGVCPN